MVLEGIDEEARENIVVFLGGEPQVFDITHVDMVLGVLK